MTSKKNALGHDGELDGQTLFVMAEVAGLWVQLIAMHATESEKELELLRNHNLGVFHGAGSLHLDFTAGNSNRPDGRDQAEGMVFYVVPPVPAGMINSPAVAALLTAFEKLGDPEQCNDSDVRAVVTTRLAMSVMAWVLDRKEQHSKKGLTE